MTFPTDQNGWNMLKWLRTPSFSPGTFCFHHFTSLNNIESQHDPWKHTQNSRGTWKSPWKGTSSSKLSFLGSILIFQWCNGCRSFLCYPGKGHVVYPCLPRDFGCKKIFSLEVVRYEVWKVSSSDPRRKQAGWWFHIFLCFIPFFSLKWEEMIQFDKIFFFQMANSSNHQLGSQYCSSSRFLDGYSKLVDGLVESFTSAGGTVKTGAKAQSQQWRWD